MGDERNKNSSEAMTNLERTLLETAETQGWVINEREWYWELGGANKMGTPDVCRVVYTPTGLIEYEIGICDEECDGGEVNKKEFDKRITEGWLPEFEHLDVFHGVRIKDWDSKELKETERRDNYIVKLTLDLNSYDHGLPEIILPDQLEIGFNPKKFFNNGDPLYTFFKSVADVLHEPALEPEERDGMTECLVKFLKREKGQAILSPRQGGPIYDSSRSMFADNIPKCADGSPLFNLEEQRIVCGEWLDRTDKKSYQKIFDYIAEFINNTAKSQ